MLSRMSKMLRNQKGFTLVELMTVLIILGVILGIGIPKYLQVQTKAEWEADAGTITNFAKAAEIYAASINEFGDGSTTGVTINQLIKADLIAQTTFLNRKNGGGNKSVPNTSETPVGTEHGTKIFTFNTTTGNVNNLGRTIQAMIGNPPYGDGPQFSGEPKTNWSLTSEEEGG